MNASKLWRWLVPLAVLLIIWFIPVPDGLKPQAWHMFAIFVATIVGILCSPLPSGAIMFISLALTIFTNTLSFKAALSGFASGTVWMIFSAYVLSLGFVKSGLGRRIAYKTLSLFGGSSLGIAFSLGIADLILAPPCLQSQQDPVELFFLLQNPSIRFLIVNRDQTRRSLANS